MRPALYAEASTTSGASQAATDRRMKLAHQQLLEPLECVLRDVLQLREAVRALYYRLVLWPHVCPTCGEAGLTMVAEGSCRCGRCRRTFDPTLVFTRCPKCNCAPKRRLSRYACTHCGRDVTSPFLFEGRVFDAAYYREKMRESRARHASREQKQRPDRRPDCSVEAELPPPDLHAVPGLVEALTLLTSTTAGEHLQPAARFALDRYERHLRACVGAEPLSLDDIPPLQSDVRLDRVWRFVAAVFLAHAGLVAIEQLGPHVMVSQYETN